MDDAGLINLKQELGALLAEGVHGAKHREVQSFDRLAGSSAPQMVLFGAGGLGRRILAGLRKHGIEPLAFADNRQAAWGTQIEGVPVMSPENAAAQFRDNAVFVVTIWGAEAKDRMRDRIDHLERLGCRRVTSFGPLCWKYPDGLLPHYGADLPHKVHEHSEDVRAAFNLWADYASCREYVNQIRWRLLLDFDCLAPPVEHTIYFPKDLCAISPEEVFVDCGAFDGDTAKLFIHESEGRFRSIIAFEPDPANFAHLKKNIKQMPGAERHAISVFHAATGSRPARVRLLSGIGKSSSVGEGDVEVDSVALDDVLGDPAPTYVKMDIEGAELDTLEGASRTIREHRPVLAICCYHRQNHLWKIPLLIRALSTDYRFFLRPHDLEMWDLVCYAIPKERLVTALQERRPERKEQ